MKSYCFSLLFFMLIWQGNLLAQEKEDSVYSKILGEQRYLQVYLPDNYSKDKKYDVVYALDGEMLGRFIPPVLSFSQENELMPPVIVIGIKNIYWYDKNENSRDRDLLPQKVEGSPLSGGADNFIKVINSEIIPYINAHYATSGKNILFGHSYGGLFTVYTFLKNPDIFDSFIASDPALWWNDGFVLKLAEQSFPNVSRLHTLFVGGRDGQIFEAFGIKKLEDLLNKQTSEYLRWQVVKNPDEHHGSVRLKNIYDGLKFTYFGYSSFMLDFFPLSGIIAQNKPVPIYLYSTYLQMNPGIRYTTDGAEPTPHSKKYDYGMLITNPAILTMKQFSNYGEDKVMKGIFKSGNIFSAIVPPSKIEAGGFNYTFYNYDTTTLIIDSLKPLSKGITDNSFSVYSYTGNTPFACKVDGYLKCLNTGYYTFFIDADYIARWYVDNQLLLTINQPADKLSSKSYVLPLAKGFHHFKLEYLHKGGDKNLSITYLNQAFGDKSTLAKLPIGIPFSLQYNNVSSPSKKMP
ncbi:hypothetical protein DVR12_13015 [Chitinophaga silvatica]|uniref:PA14 domain-containing protein n=1 Tax=Chitinophaga silvatica TaxID=2282649 RepID=A0A3E1YAL8_9BACT|nr:alpha/beta hydrolase-fold protein [Chitinophaga silvatica]RFS22708.1 hypothetical protein DVR12_13015 [Chitinophaga silvatica]